MNDAIRLQFKGGQIAIAQSVLLFATVPSSKTKSVAPCCFELLMLPFRSCIFLLGYEFCLSAAPPCGRPASSFC